MSARAKYAAVDQITPANVSRLTQAWTYEPGGPSPRSSINNLMYFVGRPNVVALNADDGHRGLEVPAEPGDARRRDSPRHDLLAGHAAARAARARHDERRQAGAARREDRAARPRASASSISMNGIMDPHSRRRGLHDRLAGRGLQEPRDLPRPHRRAQPLGHSRRSARLRSADRQGSVALPHRAASRRSELRHVGTERLAGSQGPGLVAAADRRQRERPRVRRARQRRRSELRQQPARARTSTPRASSRSRPRPASTSGTSRRRTTTSTTAT